jgi:hypothetical protein
MPTSASISNSTLERNNDVERILACISLLEELCKRWKKGVFPTIIKWSIISPFSYILKQNNKWIPFLLLYGWSNAGKTTLGKIILSIWRKYTSKTKDEYLLGFGSISSEAEIVEISQSNK